MRVDTRVRAEGHLDADRHRLAETLALRVRGLVVLPENLGRPSLLASDRIRVIAVVDVGVEPGTVLLHEADRFIGHQ